MNNYYIAGEEFSALKNVKYDLELKVLDLEAELFDAREKIGELEGLVQTNNEAIKKLYACTDIDKFLMDVLRHTNLVVHTCGGIFEPDSEIEGVTHAAGQFIRAINGLIEVIPKRIYEVELYNNIPLKVLDVINDEIDYQDKKWGYEHNRNQTIEGHLLILRKELEEAEEGWMKNKTGRNSIESEITQVASLAIQALINLNNAGRL